MKRLHVATPGATYRTRDHKLVKQLLKTGNFHIIQTFYPHKKWWQFWILKRPIGYEVMCIKDLEQ